MEVMIPPTSPRVVEFNLFDSSTTSTPYISAPSSPPPHYHQFGFGAGAGAGAAFFFSAPTSPTTKSSSSSAAFYHNYEFQGGGGGASSAVPFNWEVTPNILNSSSRTSDEEEEDMDFAFDFSGQLETCSSTADELFHGGKIKPLKPPPPRLYEEELLPPPKSPPRSPKKKLIKDYVLSPRRNNNKDDDDPFAAAHERCCREENTSLPSLHGDRDGNGNGRVGRERSTTTTAASSITISRQKKKKKTISRSLSPFRVSDLLIDDDDDDSIPQNQINQQQGTCSMSFASFWYRNTKWKLKDLLLFTSASEGRATTSSEDDQMNKYGMLKEKNPRRQQHVKNSRSFRRSTDGGSTASSRSSSIRVSAHELHYTTNRAVSQEMKKKTFLPYKRSLLGCLGLRSGMHHHFSKPPFASLTTPAPSP